jgi:hypothetical protein
MRELTVPPELPAITADALAWAAMQRGHRELRGQLRFHR